MTTFPATICSCFIPRTGSRRRSCTVWCCLRLKHLSDTVWVVKTQGRDIMRGLIYAQRHGTNIIFPHPLQSLLAHLKVARRHPRQAKCCAA
jgi:hypothetical protein